MPHPSMSDPNADDARTPRHPIRVVSERTGLTPDLLRAWESRHAVVEPGRSERAHRLYSDEDVERLRLLNRLTLSGRSIGQLAHLDTATLAALVREDAEARAGLGEGASDDQARGFHLAQALEAIHALDGVTLNRVVRRGVLEMGTVSYLETVAAPLLREVGDRWHDGALTPAHEHLASVGVRRVVEWLMETGGFPEEAPRIVITTPAGERHEIGALLAASAAQSAGWEPIYLGPDLPADDIARAVIQSAARAVAVGAAYSPAPERLLAEVRDLRQRLPPSVTILVGGRAFRGLEEAVRESRMLPVQDLPGFVRVLEELAPTPSPAS